MSKLHVSNGLCSSAVQSVFDVGKKCKVPDTLSQVNLHLNGTKYTVLDPDPLVSLNEWIRNQPGLKGTVST